MVNMKRGTGIVKIGTTLLRIILAWITGVSIYMLAMVLTVYDGILSLLFQPLVAAVFSLAFLIVVMFTSLLLKIPLFQRIWRKRIAVASSVLVAGIFLLVCSIVCIEVMVRSVDQQIVERFGRLGTATVTAGTLLVMFAIVNWPHRLFPRPVGVDWSKPIKPKERLPLG